MTKRDDQMPQNVSNPHTVPIITVLHESVSLAKLPSVVVRRPESCSCPLNAFCNRQPQDVGCGTVEVHVWCPVVLTTTLPAAALGTQSVSAYRTAHGVTVVRSHARIFVGDAVG